MLNQRNKQGKKAENEENHVPHIVNTVSSVKLKASRHSKTFCMVWNIMRQVTFICVVFVYKKI